jgi:hypothetical protein
VLDNLRPPAEHGELRHPQLVSVELLFELINAGVGQNSLMSLLAVAINSMPRSPFRR